MTTITAREAPGNTLPIQSDQESTVSPSSSPSVAPSPGKEISFSVGLRKNFYRGLRPGRGPSPAPEISQHDRLVILRGQLTLLRKRLEAGFGVTIDSLVRAERLAREIESETAS